MTKDNNYGTLYLVPNTLGKTPQNNTMPEFVMDIIRDLDMLVVENIQSTVSYLQWVGDTLPEYEIDFRVLNKKTPDHEIASFIKPLKSGRDVGLISEAGCPAVADPGSKLVAMAHAQHIKVSPLTGPSSILLALMGSGFNGQQFAFHGYLPMEKKRRRDSIQTLEKESGKQDRTQIFMEAPHRNEAIVKDVIDLCQSDTRFCTATNLTLPDESILSMSVAEWEDAQIPSLHKQPTIFLLYAKQQ